jgi:hypothetical protein
LERQASRQYAQLKQQRLRKRRWPDNYPELMRLRAMPSALFPYHTVQPRAAQWQWEVNLIGSSQINAFCMPAQDRVLYRPAVSKAD